jgi:hypothetical protein
LMVGVHSFACASALCPQRVRCSSMLGWLPPGRDVRSHGADAAAGRALPGETRVRPLPLRLPAPLAASCAPCLREQRTGENYDVCDAEFLKMSADERGPPPGPNTHLPPTLPPTHPPTQPPTPHLRAAPPPPPAPPPAAPHAPPAAAPSMYCLAGRYTRIPPPCYRKRKGCGPSVWHLYLPGSFRTRALCRLLRRPRR